VYLNCRRLHTLFSFLKNLLLKFCLHFSPTLLIHGHPVRRGAGRAKDHLVNLLLDLAKYAINRSRQRATEGSSAPNVCLSSVATFAAACPWRGSMRSPAATCMPFGHAGHRTDWRPLSTLLITFWFKRFQVSFRLFLFVSGCSLPFWGRPLVDLSLNLVALFYLVDLKRLDHLGPNQGSLLGVFKQGFQPT